MRIIKYLSSAALVFFFSLSGSIAAVDQTFVERILKENREFVDFLDLAVTNFAPDKKNELFTIYQKHFNGEVAFLQGEYKRAFDNVYSSQKDMVTLYEYIVTEFYLEDSKNILDGFAPEIIRSKNVLAKQYLTLGYRDRTVCRAYYVSGEAAYPKLYSLKIYKYIEAINMARRGKRYGFISLYTGQDPKMKLKIFNQMFKAENQKGVLFFERFIDKNEKEYLAEMEKTYEEFEKEQSKKKTSGAVETKGTTDKTETKSADVKNTENPDGADKGSFEKKMERSIRFRKEQRVARYLVNGEFDKAETIIRTYVSDYNFKLILATFNTLGTGETHTGETQSASANKDYKKFIQHHNDNYHIYNKKSILESVTGDVKVIDSIKKSDKKLDDQEKIEKGGGGSTGIEADKKLEEAVKTDKSEIKTEKSDKDSKTEKNEKGTVK